MPRAPLPIRRRHQFDALSASRTRGRSGAVRVVYAPHVEPSTAQPQPSTASSQHSTAFPQRDTASSQHSTAFPQHVAVAYALGRSVGTAVVRNRVRRRLRVLMRRHCDHGTLVPGLYLVSAGPAVADLDFGALDGHLRTALAELPAATSPGRPA